MKPRKKQNSIEQVIQVKLKDVQEAKRRMIKYVLPAIAIAFVLLFLFAFFVIPAILYP